MKATDVIPEGTFSDLPEIVMDFSMLAFTEFAPVLKIFIGVAAFFFILSFIRK